jgi:membrane-associated protease RseP (regulator of RpoE activity)
VSLPTDSEIEAQRHYDELTDDERSAVDELVGRRELPTAVPLVMLVLTLGTTFWSGLLSSPAYQELEAAVETTAAAATAAAAGAATTVAGAAAAFPHWWEVPAIWRESLAYCLGFLAILISHEAGHYLTARKYGVKASLPILVPWLPPVGTLGAVIAMRLQKMPAATLLKIAANGPLAGAVVAIVVTALGLHWSTLLPLGDPDSVMILGDNLIFKTVGFLFFGEKPQGYDVFLHPLALAGWFGFYMTAINLLPVGELDGGHISYAMFGKRAGIIARVTIAVMLLLGVFLSWSWIVFAVFVRFFVGLDHPEISSDGVVAGKARRLGFAAILLFILTFFPNPFHISLLDQLAHWMSSSTTLEN